MRGVAVLTGAGRRIVRASALGVVRSPDRRTQSFAEVWLWRVLVRRRGSL